MYPILPPCLACSGRLLCRLARSLTGPWDPPGNPGSCGQRVLGARHKQPATDMRPDQWRLRRHLHCPSPSTSQHHSHLTQLGRLCSSCLNICNTPGGCSHTPKSRVLPLASLHLRLVFWALLRHAPAPAERSGRTGGGETPVLLGSGGCAQRPAQGLGEDQEISEGCSPPKVMNPN